jgi:segregation and condensation protein B
MTAQETDSDMDPDFIRRIVEAALLASPQPLTTAQLAALFHDEERPAPGAIEAALQALREDAVTRGVELVEVASGYRFQVQADVHSYVARLWTERQVKYTRATLETLALIAYRQPITRGEIESIRGVGVNANTIKMLEEREWIRVVGHRDVPGRPELFGTTRAFLDYFGLKNLEDLPALAELNEIPDLEPQLPFGGDPPPVAAAAFEPLDLDLDADADSGADDESDSPDEIPSGDESLAEAGEHAEPELKDE